MHAAALLVVHGEFTFIRVTSRNGFLSTLSPIRALRASAISWVARET
jgi:hypothetical protein